MKKTLSLVLALIMIVGLAACNKPEPTPSQGSDPAQSGEATKPTEKPKTYVKDLSISWSAPETRNPQRLSNNYADPCYKMVYNQLVYWNFETNKLEPELATSWEISDDGLEYIFHLRDDVTFSNGEPFEADDVVYTYKERVAAVLAEEGVIILADLTNVMEDIVAVDKTTVKLTLKSPNADTLLRMYVMSYSIFNREACEADPTDGYLIGTNGWMWKDYSPGELASFKKYTDSWVWKVYGETHTETVTFRRYAEEGAQVAAMELNEICVIVGLSSINAKLLPEDKFKTEFLSCESLAYSFFNMKRGIAKDDVNLRKAIAHAFDRNDINEAVYEGGAVLTNTLWGKSQFGLYTDVEDKLQYDPELAREYLKKSSYPDGNFTFTLWVHNKWDDAAIVMQSQIQEALGCKVNIVSVDSTRVSATVKRIMADEDTAEDQYDMLVYNISLNPTGNRFAYTTNLSSATNRAFFYNAEMDELYKKAAAMSKDADRIEAYKRIQIIMNEQLAYVPLMYEVDRYTYDVRVSGVIWSPDYKMDYSRIEMTNEY